MAADVAAIVHLAARARPVMRILTGKLGSTFAERQGRGGAVALEAVAAEFRVGVAAAAKPVAGLGLALGQATFAHRLQEDEGWGEE